MSDDRSYPNFTPVEPVPTSTPGASLFDAPTAGTGSLAANVPSSYPIDQPEFPRLAALLRSSQGFDKSVRFQSTAGSALVGVFTVALLGLFWNLFSTIRTFLEEWNYIEDVIAKKGFWDVFVTIFFSIESQNGGVNPVLAAIVWAPIVLVPVLLILLIVRKVTWKGSVEKVHQQYLRTGFISQAYQLNLNLGRNKGEIVAFANKAVAGQAAFQAISWLEGQIAADPKGENAKQLKKALVSGIGLGNVVDARNVFSQLPVGLYLGRYQPNVARNFKSGAPFVVIPDETGRAAKTFGVKAKVDVG